MQRHSTLIKILIFIICFIALISVIFLIIKQCVLSGMAPQKVFIILFSIFVVMAVVAFGFDDR
jgi:hypothetical protein